MKTKLTEDQFVNRLKKAIYVSSYDIGDVVDAEDMGEDATSDIQTGIIWSTMSIEGLRVDYTLSYEYDIDEPEDIRSDFEIATVELMDFVVVDDDGDELCHDAIVALVIENTNIENSVDYSIIYRA